MSDSLFHRCVMHHEEFSFSSHFEEDFFSWKRGTLCSVEVRTKNVFYTHGTAFLHIIQGLDVEKVSLILKLKNLQTQLFLLDHQKGELQKYVFEKDPDVQFVMMEKLKFLKKDYEKVCDKIEVVLVQENLIKARDDRQSSNQKNGKF